MLFILLFMTFLLPFELCAEDDKQTAFGGDYDDVIRDLVPNLGKDNVTAQDAATKLSRIGKRAIPVLAELLRANLNLKPPASNAAFDSKQVAAQENSRRLAFYAVLALSRIKSEEAARLLIPILKDPKAPGELRGMALEAHGIEKLPEGGDLLVEIAEKDPDPEFKKKALTQLSIMPEFWVKAEKLFVEALSSPEEEIRLLAAKQCYFARIYTSANGKLIELAEKDSNESIRLQAMLALARMRTQQAVPMLVKMLPTVHDREQAQVLRTINAITGIPFRDATRVDDWWKKEGEKQYAQLAQAEAALKKDRTTPSSPGTNPQETPDKRTPVAPKTPTTPNVQINPPPSPGPANP